MDQRRTEKRVARSRANLPKISPPPDHFRTAAAGGPFVCSESPMRQRRRKLRKLPCSICKKPTTTGRTDNLQRCPSCFFAQEYPDKKLTATKQADGSIQLDLVDRVPSIYNPVVKVGF